jgi:hypothetical protein
MRVPVGIDITETWSVDLCLEGGRHSVELWRAIAERARAELAALPALPTDAAEEVAAGARSERQALEARVATADASLAEAQRDLAAYVPGSGPSITLGHVPAAKRAEIAGMMSDAEKPTTDREKAAAQHAWRREIVRWAVRGHANLKTGRGADVPFESEEARIAGEVLRVPTERQIERYGHFLGDLANVAMEPQQLDGVEKNA